MEIVEGFEFANSRGHGKYGKIITEFLDIEHGKVVKFVKGADFDTDAKKFALSLRTTLWSKGFRVKINVREDEVFASVIGERPKDDKKKKAAPEKE